VAALHKPRRNTQSKPELRSVAFRHTIRLTISIALGDALGRMLHPYRAYWIPMTIVLVLKPEFAVTFSAAF